MLILMYSMDFVISFIMLRLFYIYANKSSADEERLKKYYLLSIQQNGYDGVPDVVQDIDGKSQLKRTGNGLVALANKQNRGDLEAESFLIVQNQQ